MISKELINLFCTDLIYKNDDDIFGAYIAGLWEGDGCVMARPNAKPVINITFHRKDAPLVEKLLLIITEKCGQNTGSIYYHKTRQACYLNIYSINGLKYFTNLVNGQLRTPKANQIAIVIKWLNKKKHADIQQLPLCNNDLSQDGWLAGFIDADGSFAIRQTLQTKTTSKQTECQCIIVQRQLYVKTNKSYEEIFSKISDFLCVKLNTLKARAPSASNPYGGQSQYKLKISSAKSKKILRAYLDRFPLLSSKCSDYSNWCAADDLMIAKQHYTEQGSEEIAALKRGMNNGRFFYNWDHLYKL